MSERVNESSAGIMDLPLLTRDAARKARQAREEYGYIFPLPLTGGAARVRIPRVQDRAVVKQLPDDLQMALAEVIATTNPDNPAELPAKDASGDPRRAMEMLLAKGETLQRYADELCLMGFIEPRLVRTEADVDPSDPRCVPLTDIHPDDRLAFQQMVDAGEKEAAKRLRSFRPGSLDPVPAQPGYQTTPAAVDVPGTGRIRVEEYVPRF